MVEAATELMQHDASIRRNIPGMVTPLQAAVMRENEELVRKLLAKGADVNARPGTFDNWNDEFWVVLKMAGQITSDTKSQ